MIMAEKNKVDNISFSFKRALPLWGITIFSILIALSFSSLAFVSPAIAAPTTFIVNSTADISDTNIGDGICETANTAECTLRAAIEEANANTGTDTIEFNIPGDPSTIHMFEPTTSYPQITEEVHINGYSQPGASSNTAASPHPINSTIKIEVTGFEPGVVPSGGLFFADGSDGSSVRGLSIHGFSTPALMNGDPGVANIVVDAANVVIAGNFIGLHADGMTPGAVRNSTSIIESNNAVNYIVGGTNPEDRNIVYNYSTSNISAGIYGGAVGGKIFGNYFGMARDGVTDLTSATADVAGLQGPFTISVNLTRGTQDPQHIGNTVGGSTAAHSNLISGTTMAAGVNSSGNIIQGNLIGTDYTGQVRDSITSGIGILATAGTYNLIGGVNPGEGNLVAGVKGAGISAATLDIPAIPYLIKAEKNSILGNSIHSIGIFDFDDFGTNNMGIDIFDSTDTASDFIPNVFTNRGPNINDVGDVDDGANNRINYPVLKSAVQVGNTLNIIFDLDASGSDDNQYRIEFFANDEATIFGYGPGQTYLGSTTVEPGVNLNASINLGALSVVGKSLSATTTEHLGFVPWGLGSTSEFAQNIKVGSASDFDADGIPDSTEDEAVNSGDGNNDGTLDRFQSTVSSYTITGVPVTFVTQGCSANGNVSSLPSNAIQTLDTGYAYPYGLTDFSLNCSRGDTVTITKYIYDDSAANIADYHVRKYIPATDEYIEVDQATIESQNINGHSALVMSYSLTDGGQYDDDGIANGVIVDPVGLAQVFTSSSNTDQTGQTGNNSFGNNTGSNPGSKSVTKSASGVLSYTGVQHAVMIVLVALVLVLAGSLLFFGQRNLRQRRTQQRHHHHQ